VCYTPILREAKLHPKPEFLATTQYGGVRKGYGIENQLQ
jgi:hypothetical protein